MRNVIQNEVAVLYCNHATGIFTDVPIVVNTMAKDAARLQFETSFVQEAVQLMTDCKTAGRNDADACSSTPAGSRRLRLRELPAGLHHCANIGVCLPIKTLRRLIVKHYGAP